MRGKPDPLKEEWKPIQPGKKGALEKRDRERQAARARDREEYARIRRAS